MTGLAEGGVTSGAALANGETFDTKGGPGTNPIPVYDDTVFNIMTMNQMVQFGKEASQTRDYCVAKNATPRAARPDCLRLRSGQALTAQRTLVRNDRWRRSCGGSIPLRLWYALFKRDRDVPPHLNRQNHRSREQQRSHGHMRHGRGDHGQFRLYRVFAPG